QGARVELAGGRGEPRPRRGAVQTGQVDAGDRDTVADLAGRERGVRGEQREQHGERDREDRGAAAARQAVEQPGARDLLRRDGRLTDGDDRLLCRAVAAGVSGAAWGWCRKPSDPTYPAVPPRQRPDHSLATKRARRASAV